LSSLGFVTGQNTPGIFVQTPNVEGVPPISFNNFSIGVPGYPGNHYNNTYQILDNLSKVKGAHTIKFGGSVHFDQVAQKVYGVRNGLFGFTGVETGSDFADYLLCLLQPGRAGGFVFPNPLSWPVCPGQLAGEVEPHPELWPALGSYHALVRGQE
jgi:hypothetical protein